MTSVYHGECKRCGAPFTQRGPGRRRKFCGEECQRIWWAENREDRGKVYTYTCQICGEEYQTIYSNRDTCCSRECGFEWIARQRHEGALIDKECVSCGETFEGLASGTDYCSDECKERGVPHHCKVCGELFYGHGNACYCSDDCEREQNRRDYERYMIEKIGPRSYICEWCGEEFSAPYGDKRRRFCKPECRKKHWYSTPAGKEAKARQRHRRRARQYGNGPIDDITPIDVFERDGWLCGLCGKAVDPTLEFPEEGSASLDHIIPLAEGGTHTWGNVQLAHFICNSHKGSNGGGQLRLGFVAEDVYVGEVGP